MSETIRNVMLMGAGGLLGSKVLRALQKEGCFTITVLTRKSSSSTFDPSVKVVTIDDSYPLPQLTAAFQDQDAVISTLPGGPSAIPIRMIDAAIAAGVKRFIPTEFANNTCPEAADLVPLYRDKSAVTAYLQSHGEPAGLSWTVIHNGQFFDWGLETGWLDFDLARKHAMIYDSGDKLWSTTTVETAATTVARVLRKPGETRNRHVHVASFTVSQRQVLGALEKVTGTGWDVTNVSSKQALERVAKLEDEGHPDKLKIPILMVLYADDADRGANFAEKGWLCNELLDLPDEDVVDVVERVRQGA